MNKEQLLKLDRHYLMTECDKGDVVELLEFAVDMLSFKTADNPYLYVLYDASTGKWLKNTIDKKQVHLIVWTEFWDEAYKWDNYNDVVEQAKDLPYLFGSLFIMTIHKQDQEHLAPYRLTPKNKPFPMQHGPDITWQQAEEIYKKYSKRFGTGQSLERIAERGGFGWAEVEQLWRNE